MSQPRIRLEPTLGECMRRDRQYAGKTLAEAAAHLDISVAYLSDLERDKRGPLDAERLISLAGFYGVPVGEWLEASVEDSTAAMMREQTAEIARLRALLTRSKVCVAALFVAFEGQPRGEVDALLADITAALEPK